MRRALLLAGLLALLAAPTAQAAYDPIGQGTVKLTFEKSFLSTLKKHGISLQAKAGATLRKGTLTLPATGGILDPTKGLTTTKTGGTLLFKTPKRSLPLRRFELKANRNPLQAKVGGGQLKVAVSPKPEVSRAGFGIKVAIARLQLSAKVATRLNKKLAKRDLFAAGQRIGTLRATVSPLTTTILPRGRATLVLDPALLAKLDSLFVSVNPIFPAELAPGRIFSFQIARGGALSPDASLGTLRSAGQIEFLQQGAGQVFLDELWFEMAPRSALASLRIEPSPTFPGALGQLEALAIGPGSASSDPRARTISLSGAQLTLGERTAAAFNEAFAAGKALFGAGEAFGVLSFAAQGQ